MALKDNVNTTLMRASPKPEAPATAADLRAEATKDHSPRRPDREGGLTPDEIRRIVLDILG